MKNKLFYLIGAFVAFSIYVPTVAAEGRHEAHTHGEGSMNVIHDGNVLVIEIALPGADVVGFEHAAKQESDIIIVRAALQTLRSTSKVLKLPKSAECKVLRSTSVTSLLHDDDGHKHAGKDARHDGHGGFTAHYEFKCASSADLPEIGVNLFQVFPSLQKVNAVAVTGLHQSAKMLTADDNIISLVK